MEHTGSSCFFLSGASKGLRNAFSEVGDRGLSWRRGVCVCGLSLVPTSTNFVSLQAILPGAACQRKPQSNTSWIMTPDFLSVASGRAPCCGCGGSYARSCVLEPRTSNSATQVYHEEQVGFPQRALTFCRIRQSVLSEGQDPRLWLRHATDSAEPER